MPQRRVSTISEKEFRTWLDTLASSWGRLANPVKKLKGLLDKHPGVGGPEWLQLRKAFLKALEGLQTTVRGRCIPPPVTPCKPGDLPKKIGQATPVRRRRPV
jgi:hypothetical protein